MAKYVFAYTGGSTPQSEQEQQQVMAAWTGWFGELGAAVVDPGNPFGPSKSVGGGGAVGDGGASGLTGYSIVNADSLDDAAAKATGCPVLHGGGRVDVYEAIDVMM
jgi:hypothetical protein